MNNNKAFLEAFVCNILPFIIGMGLIFWGVFIMIKQDSSLAHYHPIPGHTPLVVYQP